MFNSVKFIQYTTQFKSETYFPEREPLARKTDVGRGQVLGESRRRTKLRVNDHLATIPCTKYK